MNYEVLLQEQALLFKAEFNHLPDEELIHRFNKQVKCLGGNTIRKVYLAVLKDELCKRNFDCSLIINKCGLRLHHKVKLQNQRLVYA
ncbi:hypothetical protein SAMN05192529_10996 [Arachidicoccus rhizosphaerae]|uniref:Uncharacterized protein n=1 Tax=Arachidicoccus rhizosphaerae TaxID=551991 RepID=A0A1H3YWL5_9BACT|nr:hypothetical protein [Arachidicoccus rhizosphaerae]SEA15846.1 hypothetical protein SAMN05192529_10996 [Arachidicoccus rhizosphaerae]